jgi:hypothetical protein
MELATVVTAIGVLALWLVGLGAIARAIEYVVSRATRIRAGSTRADELVGLVTLTYLAVSMIALGVYLQA